jgi:tetratricopeptide (TPR) repeat protein
MLLILLGNAYATLGDYQKGLELAQQGLKIAQEIKNRPTEAKGLTILASIYNQRNEYQTALDLAQNSLKIAQKLKSSATIAAAQFFLGDIYKSLGDYEKSREFYQQALTSIRQFKNRQSEGSALVTLANAHFAKGEPQITIEYSQQGLAIFREIKRPLLEAVALISLSTGYGETGNYEKAVDSVQQALTIARAKQNSVVQKAALNILGNLHRKFGRNEQAIAAYQEALAIKTDTQVAGADANIYAGLARTYRDLNQPNVAITYYKQSVNKIEEVRRGIEGLPPELQTSFLDTTIDFDRVKVSDIYRQLAALLLSQGRDREALQVQQLLREQEIREAVSPRDAARDKPNIPLTPAETKIPAQSESIIALAKQINECDRTNCSQLRELNTRRTALITEFDQQLQKIDQEIRANRAKDDAFFDPNKLAIIQEIVEAQPGKVMIYPLVLENELWIQLYAPEDVVRSIKVNVGREELGNAAKEFRDLMEECEKPGAYCTSADTAKLQAVSQKLYNWLIKPLEKELQENQVKIWFLPSIA